MALARRERFELPELFRRVLDTEWDSSYKDGVLEVRAPMAKETKPPVTRIPVTRS